MNDPLLSFVCWALVAALLLWLQDHFLLHFLRLGLRHALTSRSRPRLRVYQPEHSCFVLGAALRSLSFFGPLPCALLARPGVFLLCSRHGLWPFHLFSHSFFGARLSALLACKGRVAA